MDIYVRIILLFILISPAIPKQVLAEVNASTPPSFSASLRRSELHDALHGEIMMEGDTSPYTSVRVGLAFFLSENTGIHGGFETGARAGLPGRIAPFVGAGLFLGQWTDYEPAMTDGIDNDGDSLIDEQGEEIEYRDYLMAAYPEAGIHLGLTEKLRLTASWRYYMTTKGESSHRELFGVGVSFKF